jgi:salicylate hydroxylase
VCHPAGPHAALRNAIMSAKSQDDWFETLDWLYGGSGLD